MTSILRGLPALLLVAAAQSPAQAESLILHNASGQAVVVQLSITVRGVPRSEPPYQLGPREQTPALNLPGVKSITVIDARNPNRILYQGAIPARSSDQFFLILPDSPPPKVRLEQRPYPRQ